MNKKETDEYIRSRLRRAGLETSCFKQKAIDEIFRYSEGIPRLINILCDNSLTIGYATDKKKIDKKIIQEAIDDLEGGQRSLPESGRTSDSTGHALSSPMVGKPKGSHLAEQKKKKTRGWSFFSLIFWIYVFILAGILLLNFGVLSNQRQTSKPSSAGVIKKPIPGAKPVKLQTAIPSPPG
ncbi:MAG: hypothetical protein GTN76_08240 [Candidatus Aenigmarchaeota archaeon]|nr:hypothetical protein [Candidatus Aenigmarchaeota archaeon]